MKTIDELLQEMTLEEKISLLSGKGLWNTKEIERLGIPSLLITDGPIGIRKQEGSQDNVGLNESVRTTCFPAGATVACSWDPELMYTMAEALGEQAQAENVGVLLGPAMNIKRTPLCGRNFEYFSEDPVLTGVLASAYVKGLQSQGVASSLKHFAANNQEYRRRSINAVVDERTLRELYLPAFEMTVKDAGPATVMASYNRVNGVYACENGTLLNDILRGEWGFEGLVVSDWDATNDHALGLKNGLDLRMPNQSGKDARDMMKAYQEGKITLEEIDRAVRRNLQLILDVTRQSHPSTPDYTAHHALVRRIASESMVLLKNENGALPLKKDENVLLIGDMAKQMRYQGGGSSHVAAYLLDDLQEEMQKISSGKITYVRGYELDSDEQDETLFQEALEAAEKASVIIVCAGLPERYESEGYDREHLSLPEVQNRLIEALSLLNRTAIVVLANGGAVLMPWKEKVSGILETYLGGEAAGGAIADILYGCVNPSGKLAETFPKDIRHTPAYLNYPGHDDTVIYKEGVFAGYRYYTAKAIEPLFPFGFGLSYTTFAYSDISIDRPVIYEDETAVVSCTIKNTGSRPGKEVVQLYVKDNESSLPRPEYELKHFAKIYLEPGEEKIVSFNLSFRDFAFYDTGLKRFAVESGVFTVLIGSASDDLPLALPLTVNARHEKKPVYTRYSTFGDIMQDEKAWPKMRELAMKDPFYNMVFSGKFQNADPQKLLAYNLLKELGDTDTIGEEALEELLKEINK